MAKPPSNFPRETKSNKPCGSSWSKSLVVNGSLPGWSFGKDFKHTVTPIVSSVPAGVDRYDEKAEELRDKIQARVNDLRDRTGSGAFAPVGDDAVLTAKQAKSLQWLLDSAEVELARALGFHDKWEDRQYSLNKGDTLDDFYGPCGGRPGAQVEVSTAGRPTVLQCPTLNELKSRALDRAAIRLHFTDALYHVRCAEYGYWKLAMVAKAQDAAGVGELDFAPAADPEPADFDVSSFKAFFYPEAPGTLDLPDPDDLPPPGGPDLSPGPDGLPPAFPPGGVEGAPLFDGPEPAPTKPSNKKAAVLALGGLALAAAFWKMR